MSQICLVACARKKTTHATRAESLYVSPLFKKSRRYALGFDRWYILSAKYGVLEPSLVVEPYEMTLKQMTKKDRHAWSRRVARSICNLTAASDRIVILAGLDYREELIPLLRDRKYIVDVPMKGLGIGQQLHWLDKQSLNP